MNDAPDPTAKNFAIREFSAACPKLRHDIQFHFDSFRGETCCILEDPLTTQFFRVGTAEYHFIKYLNGENTISEALAKMAQETRSRAINEQQAFQILNQLLSAQMIQTEQSSTAEAITQQSQDMRAKKLKGKMNPLFLKIPLFNPDRMLNSILPVINFLMGYPFLFIWLMLMTYGGYHLHRNWEYVAFATPQAFLPSNWIFLIFSWVLLKCVHENFHGFAVKRFGGYVPEAGLMFILFTPMGYVDATSVWRIRSKWKRIIVGLAGMYIELFFAALGLLFWLKTEPGLLNSFAYNIMITGSVVTLFFNANPLMRFDGYYILSDFLELPNMYSKGMARVKAICRKYLIGVKTVQLPKLTKRDELWITAYGIAAVMWKCLLLLTLTITASFLLKGFGIILAAIAAFSWFLMPAIKFFSYLREGNQQEIPRPAQYLPRMGIFAAILLLLAFIPVQPTITLHAVIYNQDVEIIRSEAPGFIKEQFITEKQQVYEGDPLISLDNQDELTSLKNLKLELDQSVIRSNMYLSEDLNAEYQSELGKIDALKTQIQELTNYVNTLELTASADGIIIPSPQEWEDGAFVDEGTPLFTIYPNEKTQATIAINQQSAEPFEKHMGKDALLKLKGSPIVLKGTFKDFNPRSTQALPHPALSAKNGGPLGVLPGSGRDDKPKLISPHFTGSMIMDIPRGTQIHEGQTGIIKFDADESKFIWRLAYEKIENYIDSIVQTAREATRAS